MFGPPLCELGVPATNHLNVTHPRHGPYVRIILLNALWREELRPAESVLQAILEVDPGTQRIVILLRWYHTVCSFSLTIRVSCECGSPERADSELSLARIKSSSSELQDLSKTSRGRDDRRALYLLRCFTTLPITDFAEWLKHQPIFQVRSSGGVFKIFLTGIPMSYRFRLSVQRLEGLPTMLRQCRSTRST